MGLIAPSFFGTRGSPARTRGCSPFPSHFWAAQVSGGLALTGTNYSVVYLGFDTIFVSSGTSPVTLPPGWGRWGTDPLLRPATGEHRLRFFVELFY